MKKMNHMKNLLKELRIGDQLYSPLCGKCRVISLEEDEIFGITVRTPYLADFSFDRYGRYALCGAPLLFPL